MNDPPKMVHRSTQMHELYVNIKKRREQLGISQIKLAELTGYSDRSSISKIESGNVDLALSKVEAIAEVLQTDPIELMGWNFSSETLEPSETHLIDVYRDLNDDGQDKVTDYAEDLAENPRYIKRWDSDSVQLDQEA